VPQKWSHRRSDFDQNAHRKVSDEELIDQFSRDLLCGRLHQGRYFDEECACKVNTAENSPGRDSTARPALKDRAYEVDDVHEPRMDALDREYAETHDQTLLSELKELSRRLRGFEKQWCSCTKVTLSKELRCWQP
jgi:hypothetical protein